VPNLKKFQCGVYKDIDDGTDPSLITSEALVDCEMIETVVKE